MPLLRYAGILVSTFLGLYAALIGLSYLLYPSHQSAATAIDTADSPKTIYATEPKYLLFSMKSLHEAKPRILLIGASNVREGLRPAQLHTLLGNEEIDNLAVGASNIRQLEQIVDFSFDEIPRESWRQTTFVVGIWYATFAPDDITWPGGLTDLNVEELRYGLYRVKNGAPSPRLPAFLIPAAEVGLRPLLMATRIYNDGLMTFVDRLRISMLRAIGAKPADVEVTDPRTFTLTPEQRQASLIYWRNYMGPPSNWNDKTLSPLIKMARTITAHGSKLVLLDLPLPRWHREAIPQYEQYERQKINVIQQIKALPGVTYYSLGEDFPDESFYDSAHPRPQYTWLWARQAAGAITIAEPVAH